MFRSSYLDQFQWMLPTSHNEPTNFDVENDNQCDCGVSRLMTSQAGLLEVCSLEEARTNKLSTISGLITIENSSTVDPLRRKSIAQLVLKFDDIALPIPGFVEPKAHHIDLALDFAREFREKQMLIHCHAGISRSTAICLAIFADRLGRGKEQDACRALLSISPQARPNALIIHLTDEVLQRHGKLFQCAWKSMQLSTPR